MNKLTNDYYNQVKDYLHPNTHTFADHYRKGDLIEFPIFHGCNHVNRNGTRKLIKYEIGHQCVVPTNCPYWRKPKDKYRHSIKHKKFYCTRYLTFTRTRFLFKNKGDLVYNYKLKKFEHMSETPMYRDWNYLQQVKKDLLNNVQK